MEFEPNINNESSVLRLKASMVLFSLEQSLGHLVRDSGINPAETSPALVREILDREDIDYLDHEELEEKRLVISTISASYLDEIFQLAIDTNLNSNQGEKLKCLKFLCENLSIFDIRNAISHPNRPFPDCYWYRAASIGTDPLISQLGLSDVSHATQNAISGKIEPPPEQWLAAQTWFLPNNLPHRFEHSITGLIGRRSEFNELHKFVFNPRVHSTAIIGSGGLGKTALALEFLESICLDPANKTSFDGIAFISLKERFLSAQGIAKIDAIATINELSIALTDVFRSLYDIDEKTFVDVKKVLERKNILLCIDNLETLLLEHQNAFSDFCLELPPAWKLLVTSRVQVIEFSSVVIAPIEKKFAVNLAKAYTNRTSNLKFSEEEYAQIAICMNQNPLAIKLTIDSCKLGKSLNDALRNVESDVIEFSYSGLIDSLTPTSIKILELLFSADAFSRSQINEFFEDTDYDEKAAAINQLFHTSLVERRPGRDEEETISLNSGIRDYLRIHPRNLKIRDAAREKISKSRAVALNRAEQQEALGITELHANFIPDDTPEILVSILVACFKELKSPRDIGPSPLLLKSLAELKSRQAIYGQYYIYHRTYARILLKLGDYRDAIDHLRIALEIEPGNLLTTYLLVKGLHDNNQEIEAEEILEGLKPQFLLNSETSNTLLSKQLLSVYLNTKLVQHKYDEILLITKDWRISPYIELLGSMRANALKRSVESLHSVDARKAEICLIEALDVLTAIFEAGGTSHNSVYARAQKILKDCIYLSTNGVAMSRSELAKATLDFSLKYVRRICDTCGGQRTLEYFVHKLRGIDVEKNSFSEHKWIISGKTNSTLQESDLLEFRQFHESRGFQVVYIDSIRTDINGSNNYAFATNGNKRFFVNKKSVSAAEARACWTALHIGQMIAIMPVESDDDQLEHSCETHISDYWCAWERAEKELPLGLVTKGVVQTCMDYGAFVRLPNGLSALAHISRMSGITNGTVPHDFLQPGEEIEVKVLEFDKISHRISLSYHHAGED